MIKDPTKCLMMKPEPITYTKLENIESVTRGLWDQINQKSYQRQTYVHTGQGGKDMILEALKAFDSLRELDKLKKEKELLQKPTSELIDIVLNDIDKLK